MPAAPFWRALVVVTHGVASQKPHTLPALSQPITVRNTCVRLMSCLGPSFFSKKMTPWPWPLKKRPTGPVPAKMSRNTLQ